MWPLPRYKGREVNFPKVPLAAATWFALLLFASCNPEFLSWFEVWWMRDEGEEECSMEQTRGLAHSRLQNRGRLWNNIFVLHWITNVVKRRQSKILTWRQSNTENEQTNASYIERITILDNVKHEGTDIHEQCKSKRTPSDGRRTMPPKVPSKCEKKTPSYLKMCEKQNSKMLLLLLSRNRFRSYKNAGVAIAIKSSKKSALNFCLINKLHMPQISSGITEASNATNFSKCQSCHATSPSQQKIPEIPAIAVFCFHMPPNSPPRGKKTNKLPQFAEHQNSRPRAGRVPRTRDTEPKN
jgi:hypothetical protein